PGEQVSCLPHRYVGNFLVGIELAGLAALFEKPGCERRFNGGALSLRTKNAKPLKNGGQLFRSNRLANEIGSAELHDALAGIRLDIARDYDDDAWQILTVNDGERFVAVHDRHIQVKKENIPFPLPDQVNGFAAVVGEGDLDIPV